MKDCISSFCTCTQLLSQIITTSATNESVLTLTGCMVPVSKSLATEMPAAFTGPGIEEVSSGVSDVPVASS